jgi:hypothetical protein
MVSARRVVGVTLGLVGAGALLGALAGGVALAFSALIRWGDPSGSDLLSDLLLGAFFGAPLGALTAPILAWLLLRRVPLGRMFLGSVAGGVVGWITTTTDFWAATENGLAGAFIGCVVACILLRRRRLEA